MNVLALRLAVRMPLATVATAAPASPAPAALSALTRRSRLFLRDRRSAGIAGTWLVRLASLTGRPLLLSFALRSALSFTVPAALTFVLYVAPLAALAVARLIALATRLLLSRLCRTLPRLLPRHVTPRFAPLIGALLATIASPLTIASTSAAAAPSLDFLSRRWLALGCRRSCHLLRLTLEPAHDCGQPVVASRHFRNPLHWQRGGLCRGDALYDGFRAWLACLFLLELGDVLFFRSLDHVERRG